MAELGHFVGMVWYGAIICMLWPILPSHLSPHGPVMWFFHQHSLFFGRRNWRSCFSLCLSSASWSLVSLVGEEDCWGACSQILGCGHSRCNRGTSLLVDVMLRSACREPVCEESGEGLCGAGVEGLAVSFQLNFPCPNNDNTSINWKLARCQALLNILPPSACEEVSVSISQVQ